MPYIEKEKVSEIRKALKKALPELKMSVVRRHHSEISVAILEAPGKGWEKYDGKHEQVNQFYIKEHYENEPAVRKVLLKIHEIIVKDQRELVYDGDYGSVPTYYENIEIGKWDRPFKMKGAA